MKLEIRYRTIIGFGGIYSWFWVKIGSDCYFFNTLTYSKKKRRWKNYFYSLSSLYVTGVVGTRPENFITTNGHRIIDSGAFEIESHCLLRKLKNMNDYDSTAALIKRLKTYESLEKEEET